MDSALSLILSVASIDDTKAQIAIQTIYKMLQNLFHHQDEMKYRSIRLENSGFQTKVATVDGGLDLMFAAGFHLSYSNPNPNPDSDKTSSIPSEEEVCYLVHTMDEISRQQLEYCLFR